LPRGVVQRRAGGENSEYEWDKKFHGVLVILAGMQSGRLRYPK
jgi:hypothetical protein